MHCSFSTTVLAAFSVLSVASASPIAARDVCGAAPIGTAAQTPLSQPTGISTAADCAAQCQGNPACLSFLFGLVDGVDKCLLYSVPASSLPPQTNLVAYDIRCTSIPSVVPTAANPGGLNIGRRQQGAQGATTGAGNPALNPATGSTAAVGTHAAPLNAILAGNPNPIAQPTEDSLGACLAACEGNPACIAYTFESGVCKLFGPANARRQATVAQGGASTGAQGAQDATTGAGNPAVNPATSNTQVGTRAAPLNAQPAGAPAPISTPAVDDLAACLAACKGNPSCIAYTFESGVCNLYGPTATRRQSGAQSAQGATTGAGNPALNPAPGSTTAVGTHAAPLNAIPAGAPAPIATPEVDDLSACLAACKGNPSCIAYTFESGVCKLFA